MGLKEAAALRRGGKLREAEAECRRALASNPWDARVCHLLGTVLHQRGQSADAVELLRRAVALEPDVPELHVNFAALLGQAGKLEEALEHLTQAVKLRSDIPELHNNLGVTLEKLGKFEEAAAAYRTAIALRNEYPEAHCNLGNALRKRERFDEAVAAYRRAIALRESYGNAHAGLSDAYGELGDPEQSLAARRRAVELMPDRVEMHSDLLFTLHYPATITPRERLEEARRWAGRHGAVAKLPPPQNDRDPDRRLRLGYLSPDFRAHTITHLIEPVLQAHDRERFEVYCYSAVTHPDKVTARLRRLPVAWRDVSRLSDEEAAETIRRNRIDILIELAGHMGGNRLLVMARRPAPVQVQLGYASTTGLDTIDYRITDGFCDPPGTEDFYSEKLVRLPDCAWLYKPSEPSPEVGPLPMLSAGYVTFGCLNKAAKITDEAIGAWCEILKRVPGSRLIVLSPTPNPRLVDRFARRGLDRRRLELVGRCSREEYLRLFNRIDIALDPFPYNGDTTTCDGLWMGVPMVTLAGDAFVSRRGVSHLANVELIELVGKTTEEYVESAVRLASEPQRLAQLRATLRPRMSNSPLTNWSRYMAHLEAAYREIWRTWCRTRLAGECEPRHPLNRL